MGGHHHSGLPEIPDFRIYRVEDAPELVRVQKALARQGLSDPWLRNEVWKFTGCNSPKARGKLLKEILLRGFKYGAIAAAATVAIEFFLLSPKGKQHGH